MRKRFLLVTNTSAGHGRRERVDRVVRILRDRGCTVDTLSDQDQRTLDDAEALESYDGVIAAGGDGTVRRLLMTEAGGVLPIGMIPNGTGNVLAHEIGLRSRPELLADVLIAGPEQSVQTARFGSDLFLLMLGFGFDGRVIQGLNSVLKEALGKLAYVPAVLRALAGQPQAFRLTIDGKVHTATWAVIANARHYAGGFMLAPQASLTKPMFEVVLFGSMSRFVRLRQLLALANNRAAMAPDTQIITGRDIRLEQVPKGLHAQADGDALDVCPTHITFGNPVRLIVPRRYTR